MDTVHQIIFYILWIMVFCYDVFADYTLWKTIRNGRLYEIVNEDNDDIEELKDLLGEKRAAVIVTVGYSLITIGILLINFGLYKQVRFFHLPVAEHTALTLLMISILSSVFELIRFPSPMRPKNRLNKLDLVFSICFSIICYLLLFFMIITVI